MQNLTLIAPDQVRTNPRSAHFSRISPKQLESSSPLDAIIRDYNTIVKQQQDLIMKDLLIKMTESITIYNNRDQRMSKSKGKQKRTKHKGQSRSLGQYPSRKLSASKSKRDKEQN